MQTRERILSVALELFHREGYERTGIQAIVDGAGITKPSLYHHFGNKRGLLHALLQEGFAPFWPRLEQAARYDHDIVATLEQTARAYFDFAQKNRTFYQWVLGIVHAPQESDPGQEISGILERQWNLLESLFSQAALDHGNMKGRAKRYSFTYLGMIHTQITTAFHGKADLTDEDAFWACKLFMHGIFS